MRGDCFYQKEKPPGLPKDTPDHARSSTRKGAHQLRRRRQARDAARARQPRLHRAARLGQPRSGRRASRTGCASTSIPRAGCSPTRRARRCASRTRSTRSSSTSFVKTSGSRGVHVFVPIRVGPDADEVKDFAIALGAHLARAFPDELTDRGAHRASARAASTSTRSATASRRPWSRPYSVRRRPRAPVSTPLDWSELDPKLDPADFNITNTIARLERTDPWRDFFRAGSRSRPRCARCAPFEPRRDTSSRHEIPAHDGPRVATSSARWTSTAASSGSPRSAAREPGRPLHAGLPRRARRRRRAQVELTYNWDPEALRRRAQLRPPRLRGRRHLRDLPAPAGRRRDDQPPAARRPHGVHPLARPDLDRAAAEGQGAAAVRAVVVDAEYGRSGDRSVVGRAARAARGRERQASPGTRDVAGTSGRRPMRRAVAMNGASHQR